MRDIGDLHISAVPRLSPRRLLSPEGSFQPRRREEAGLIARVAPKGEHLDMAQQLAQSIARHPPLSVRSTVRSRRYFMETFEREIAAQTDPMKLYLTEDFREAVLAHLEKREPGPFHGR